MKSSSTDLIDFLSPAVYINILPGWFAVFDTFRYLRIKNTAPLRKGRRDNEGNASEWN